MKSIKRKIEKKLRRKTSPSLVASIINSKKNSKWHEISALISRPRRKEIKLNLDQINQIAKDNETILIPGKVLGEGEINKKLKIVAMKFSQSAAEKLRKDKIEFYTINEEMKKNPDAKNIRILKSVEK
ncbi:MAG TPA: 50S ribosomal protein L18e [Candidatus Nanoarchaeia archaeon]|nr:50S ribosomal protein L18e [Candidatus Nanoarchaeia archaeon]